MTVIIAKKKASISEGLEFAIIGWIPIKITDPIQYKIPLR